MNTKQQSKELDFLYKELDRLNRCGIEGNYKNAVIIAIKKLEEYYSKKAIKCE